MNQRAFSLLELMVTITVVALLTGVAVVNYKRYVIRSRVATAFEIMKHYSELGQEYYEAHGEFGDASALGIPIAGQPYLVANPQTVNPFTSQQIVDVDATSKCYNNIRFTFDHNAIDTAQDFDIQMVIRIKDGKYIVTCGIPWDEDATSYAAVLDYFPASCRAQNDNVC